MSGAHTSDLARVRTRNSAFHDHFDEATVTNPNPTTKKTNDGSTRSVPTSRIKKSQHSEAFDEVQRK